MKFLKELLLLAGSLGLCLILICCSPDAKQGVMNGLTICMNVLVPSMFPFLVVSNFVAMSSVSATLAKWLGPLFSKLFRLPENTAGVVLLSLVSGYPTGAVMTSSLLEHQEIDRETGARLMKFCFNSGLPFSVSAVGAIMLNNQKAGILLFVSNLLSTLLIGLADARRRPKNARNYLISYPLSGTDALSQSVKKGISAMLSVCAYVILFSALDGLVGRYVPYREYILPLFEITSGSVACAQTTPLPLMAFYLGFGGLCIHLQLALYLRQTGMKLGSFLKCRLLQGGFSFLICKLLLLLFPQAEPVFSNLSHDVVKMISISVPVTVFMIIMSVVLLIDIDNQKKIC